jgi:putative peptidoglycan lipid II flippase
MGTKIKDFEKPYSLTVVLWIVFFCYSTFAALFFQKLLLPMFPSFHGGSGLINADSLVFHTFAVSFAESVKLHGWSAWAIYSQGGVTGNAALLGVLYAIFGSNDPALVIPVNAAVHATSGVIIYAIGHLLFPGRIGVFSGCIAGILFVFFPSSLNWYAQVHKDGYTILGMLIIMYAWLTGIESTSRFKSAAMIICGTFLGILFELFVRPYNIKLLIASSICIFIFILIYQLTSKEMIQKKHLSICFFLVIMILSVTLLFIPKTGPEDRDLSLYDEEAGGAWSWKKSKLIPDKLEHQIEIIAKIRVHNIISSKNLNAKSLIDEYRMPDSVQSVITYAPRALGIALFAPFPKDWFGNFSILRLVGALETSIWYLIFPGLFILLYIKRPSLPIYVIIIQSFVFLIINGFTLPNVGTLYRIRYGYIFLLIILGIAGWLTLFNKKHWFPLQFGKELECSVIPHNTSICKDSIVKQSRVNITKAGIMVVACILLSNLLFFARDVLLARWFGLSSKLDIFFIAMIVPTFLVTTLSMPLGTTVISPFLSAKNSSFDKAMKYISNISTMIFFSMVILCILLYLSLFTNTLMPIISQGFSAEKAEQIKHMSALLMPIFLFSGFIILGNSTLNALGKYLMPSLAQSSVPIMAIFILLLWEKSIGIYALALGMIIGELTNLWIIYFLIKREGLSLVPVLRKGVLDNLKKSSKQLKELWSQYNPLVLSAMFISLAVLINNIMAATLESGSIAALNLGNKFVFFFTGVIGTGISTVMLPYFSSYFAGNRLIDMRRELSFFLFLSTVLTIAIGIFLFITIESIIRIAFQGGLFTNNDVRTVARIVEYGIIQLPFFAVNILFSRYATANQKNKLVMITSLCGLVANIGLNFLLIKHIGVAGIALASTLSILISALLFIVMGRRFNDIMWVDIVMITLTWMLFLTLILCFHYHSFTGIIISASTLLLIMLQHFRLFLAKS